MEFVYFLSHYFLKLCTCLHINTYMYWDACPAFISLSSLRKISRKLIFFKHIVVLLLFLFTLDSLYFFLLSFRFCVFTTKYTVHWGKYSTSVNSTKHDSMMQWTTVLLYWKKHTLWGNWKEYIVALKKKEKRSLTPMASALAIFINCSRVTAMKRSRPVSGVFSMCDL